MTAPSGIRASGLSKTYVSPRGSVPAVNGLDLDVHEGEFFGLLGPNGAGKSTTIAMLTALARPDAGTAEVAGVDVLRDPVLVRQLIGVAPQRDALDRQLAVAANLEFRGRMFGMSRRDAVRRADELLERFALADRRKAGVNELSGGQLKRLVVARALVHRPRVLFLDEPTAGVDPQSRHNLWELLRDLHGQGQTILLTTHYLEEAEALCGRVAVLDHGKVIACDEVAGLTALAGADTVVTITYDSGPPDRVKGLEDHPAVSRVEVTGTTVKVFSSSPEVVLADLVSFGYEAGARVTGATTIRPSLESAFLMLTGREYRE